MDVLGSNPDHTRVLIFGDCGGDRYRAGRTARALARRGIAAEDRCGRPPALLAEALAAAPGPVWLLRAGTWPVGDLPLLAPPPSDTGLPLCALGAVVASPTENTIAHEEAAAWSRLQAATGGDFSRAGELCPQFPPPASAFLERPVVDSLVRRLEQGEPLSEALVAEFRGPQRRVVRFRRLDVHFDAALRIVQVVTSLQQGGAERIALELHRTLACHGVRSRLVTLGKPTRAAFAVPEATIDVSRLGPARQQRVAATAETALHFAADLLHGHLLDGDDVRRLAACGVPLLLTVHNMRPGWPTGLDRLEARDVVLLAACAQAVEAELRAAGLMIPTRTVWNGVDFAPLERTAAVQEAARRLRQQHGIGPDDFVLLALANPRPQKRLERLPAILVATRAELARRCVARKAWLLMAGEPSCGNQAAAESAAALRTTVAACGVEDHVRLIGALGEIAPLLAAADVLVCCSAYEGLSLAHLEALAAGLPVVATAVGGTPELGHDNPAVSLLPNDATAEQFAAVLAGIAANPPPSGRSAAAVHFTRFRMVERYRRLYGRAIAAARRPVAGDGLWLIINNFSSGGAQSSARRLLCGLAAQGIRVRAAVLEEQPEYPTPGHRALMAAGIPVVALPPAGTLDPAEAVSRLLEHLDGDPPQAVLLWNVITEYKILLADELLHVPVYDVSPGEMYFASLERYFQRPRPGLPYRTPQQYGARLAGVIVKYCAEAAQAADWLGAPVHVVPNGVPLQGAGDERAGRFSDQRQGPGASYEGADCGQRSGLLVLGTAARISPQKKLEELLAAVRQAHARLAPYVLRIAGGVERGAEDYAAHLRQMADGLPVQWVGELEDPRPFYRELDLFAMISEPAGCPNASLEAMAAGVPVVATDFGGAGEQIIDGVTGRLVPRGQTAALAESLVALAQDAPLRARYGAAGRARVAERFDEQRMIADYRRILLEE